MVPQVTFFSFDSRDKLPTSTGKRAPQIENRWGALSWGQLCEKTHQAVLDFAQQRPDVKVVIKTKANSRHEREITDLFMRHKKAIPPNLAIITGGDVFDVLKEANVVVGFNSTAQLEALAAGLPVVVPWFDEAIAPHTRDFVIDLNDAVDYARSPEELITFISHYIDNQSPRGTELSPSVKSALRKWTGNDDGCSTERVLVAVREELIFA